MANYQVGDTEDTAPDSEVPSDDEVNSVLKKIQAARQQAVTPIDQAKFDAAEDQAKQLYKDQADRSEWQSLAEKVGRSLIQYNNAQTGLARGIDLSHVDLGPQTDWAGQTKQAASDYQTELGLQEQRRQKALENQKQEMGLAEKAFDVASRDKALQSQEARAAAGREASENRLDKRLAASEAANNARMGLQESLQTQRMKQQADLAEKADARRFALEAQHETSKDLAGQISVGQKQAQIGQELGNELLNTDLSSKSLDRVKAKWGQKAGDAGIDLDALQTALGKQETMLPSWAGGKSSEDEMAAKKKVLNDYLAPLKQKVEQLHQQKQELYKRGVTFAPPMDQTSSPPPDSGLVKVRGPSGTIANMTPEAASKYLGKPGYSKVD